MRFAVKTFQSASGASTRTFVQSLSSLRQQVLGALTVALLGTSAHALADTYPSRPVKVVVGSTPGGPSDFLGRLYAETVGGSLGQTFIVENKAGASGTLAAETVAKAAPDGYTLLLGAQSSIAVAPYTFAKLGYDPAKDLVPVSMVSFGGYFVVVHSSVPARTMQELVSLLRSKPGTLSFGSGGKGAGSHLCGEQLSAVTGGGLLHVPYKGDAAALNDVLGGQVNLMFATPSIAIPQAKTGKLRILAVTTKERLQSMPDIPSVHETGLKDFECSGWSVLFAPAGTPKPVLDTLRAAWTKARAQNAVKTRLEELGMTLPDRFTPPEALNTFMKTENARLGKVIKDAGIKPE